MYDYLRGIRSKIAEEERMPAYIVFSNTALQDMCVKRPVTLSEFLNVNGVGENKLNRYGNIFTCAIGRYIEYENGFYTTEELELTPQQLAQVANSYTKGCRVLHKTFGKGTVVQKSESNTENIVKIKFDSGEEKMFSTAFFGMKVID